MKEASARHILVETEEKCTELMDEINSGSDFSELAKTHSQCPSGQQGGDLVLWSQSSIRSYSLQISVSSKVR